MENKKVTFWVIIVLLLILLPITIFSTTMHFKNGGVNNKDNKNHEFKYDGKLYFYDNDELLGIYDCKNSDGYCDYARTSLKYDYSLDERKNTSNNKLPIINKQFVFLIDSDNSKLSSATTFIYDLKSNRVIEEYKTVKNYGIGIDNDYYIVKNKDDLWGVINFKDIVNIKIPFEYEYIGLPNIINNEQNKIDSDIFAIKKDGKWQLMDINGATFTNLMDNEIVSYDSKYIVVKRNDSMNLIDYNGSNKMTNYKYINFYNKYLEMIDISNNFYLYDLNTNKKVSNTYQVDSIDIVKLETKNNEIKLNINDKLEETIAIE